MRVLRVFCQLLSSTDGRWTLYIRALSRFRWVFLWVQADPGQGILPSTKTNSATL